MSVFRSSLFTGSSPLDTPFFNCSRNLPSSLSNRKVGCYKNCCGRNIQINDQSLLLSLGITVEDLLDPVAGAGKLVIADQVNGNYTAVLELEKNGKIAAMRLAGINAGEKTAAGGWEIPLLLLDPSCCWPVAAGWPRWL